MTRRSIALSFVLAAAVLSTISLAGCSSSKQTPNTSSGGSTPSGTSASSGSAASSQSAATAPTADQFPGNAAEVTKLKIVDEKVGTGAEAVAGKRVSVHYTGWLVDGTKFDSSRDRNQPFQFNLGAGEVIQGWDQGVAGMKVGGVRILTIPPTLGYGAQGAGGQIPPNATLVFKVELIGVQ